MLYAGHPRLERPAWKGSNMSAVASSSGPTIVGHRRPPRNGGAPKSLVVVLHGYGADGADLLDLSGPIQDTLPDAEVLAPDAPFPCEAGFGRQWFTLVDRSLPAMHKGAVGCAPLLEAFVAAELEKRRLPGSRLFLAGFSQGCMMALHLGLRRAEAPAAILGYSGVLVGADMLASEIRCRPPVLVVHGVLDDLVPIAALDHTEGALRAAGVPVTSLRRPALGHGIDQEGVAAGLAFLHQHQPVG